ncbi:response regulator transcription factor [Maricaulis maris]|uniref:LuxR family two component transcriptional regulator n=1 Tax=Maricaulis maris TaxID=74318 RepID=A0A495D5V5_9PROT|nr:response regulator transcription factor [Maricaulis maris]RKQ96212.1 LuxR family two component transcriptional regulator [Maricaulis maris]
MNVGERRIALVDDHRMFADGFGVLLASLRPDYQVRTFDEPIAFLRLVETAEAFDLVILDLVMRSMNGLAVLAAMRERKCRAPVLIISGIGTEPPLAEMRALGARGFVHKTADTETLVAATDAILAGRSFFPTVSAAGGEDGDGTDGFDDLPLTDGLPSLAPRQLEILHLIGRGETNKMIAVALNISENTVKSHLRAIFEALGVHTRTACVRKAQALGLI